MRIVRICTKPETRDKRLQELKEMLIDREYRPGMIDAAIQKARAVPRALAIRQVAKAPQSSMRPVFVVSFDPRLPDLSNITQKHWRSMNNMDPYLAEVFKEPPLIAYRRPANIKDKIVRAKLARPTSYPARRITGMKKCGKPFCGLCPYIKEGNTVKHKKGVWQITSEVNCDSTNVCYIIKCNKDNCQEYYIGETGNELRKRITQHRGYVNNKETKKATGFHFNLPGHSITDMKVTILEKIRYTSEAYRKKREELLISKFDSFYNGMNRMI